MSFSKLPRPGAGKTAAQYRRFARLKALSDGAGHVGLSEA
jgi:hypothetical protein